MHTVWVRLLKPYEGYKIDDQLLMDFDVYAKLKADNAAVLIARSTPEIASDEEE